MPDFQRAKNLAEQLQAEFAYARPPIDPEVIAEGLGVKVVYAQFGGDFAQTVSGYIELDAQPRIVVNAEMGTARKTFTIAHELGHFLMHRDWAKGQNYEVLPRLNNYGGPKPEEEVEADAFAANLLVPLDMLAHYRRLVPVSELPKLFLVSPQVIENRLKWLRSEVA